MKIIILKLLKIAFFSFVFLGISYVVVVLYNQFRTKNIYTPIAYLPLIQHSGELLLQVKTQKATQEIEQELSLLSMDTLKASLSDDSAKKTFWINIYNAYYQLLYTRDKKRKPEIFTEKSIVIANTQFSLDDIEHGILRKYRWKYSLGYLENIFTSSLIKDLAVDTIDYRIHFALNCGAKSCPPIAFYQYEKIEEQLDKATRAFLLSETSIHQAERQIKTSMILSWFRGDFGGKKGIKRILGSLFNQDLEDYSIDFNEYNWDAAIANFAEEER